MRDQLEDAVIARNRDNRADPAARQGKPLPRPVVCRRAARNETHSPIFPGKARRSSLAAGRRARDASEESRQLVTVRSVAATDSYERTMVETANDPFSVPGRAEQPGLLLERPTRD